MNTKNKTLVCLFMVFTLVLQVFPASAQGELPPPLAIEVTGDSLDDDADWPVIKTETRVKKDPTTGQDIIETTFVRREPPTKEKSICKEMIENKAAPLDVAAKCVINRYSVVQQAEVPNGNGTITGYVKNIADEYCSSIAGCGFFKMKKLQVWWTRSATYYSVINAKVTWGCSSTCALCTDGTTTYLWRSEYFKPTWNGLKTVTKTWTSSSMPIMGSMTDYGGYPIGGSDSTTTAPNGIRRPLSVYTTFFSP